MINKALLHYNFHNPSVELIRHNENMTYKIIDNEKVYVLRIHKPTDGFNLDMLSSGRDKIGLITDEINLLNYLTVNRYMQVQQVKLNSCEKPVTILDNNIPVTILEWVEGTTLENIKITAEIANKLGMMIGQLHNKFKQNTFNNRYYYDSILLSKMITEADKASKQGDFNNKHAKIVVETLSNIRDYLSYTSDRFILVHADLGKSNLIYHNETIIPIDFSLSGYCIPEMDLASAFTHINNESLNQNILSGYESICKLKIDNFGIEICFCLQILLFIIFQYNKFARETWFQDKLNDWCEKYFIPLNEKHVV